MHHSQLDGSSAPISPGPPGLLALLATILAALALGACRTQERSPSPHRTRVAQQPSDAAASSAEQPALARRIPADGARDVRRDTRVVAFFLVALRPDSTREALTVSVNGRALAGQTRYDAASGKLVFEPSEPLPPTSTVAVRLADTTTLEGLVCRGGAWSFTTGAELRPVGEPVDDDFSALELVGGGAPFRDRDGTEPPRPTSGASSRPTVVSLTPAEGSSGVPRNATVSARFSMDMGLSAESAAKALALSVGGAAVAGTIRYDAKHQTITFAPAVPLPPKTQVVVRLGRTTAGDGETCAAREWTFTTGD